MEHIDRIEICSNCRHRGFEKDVGTICQLTRSIPDFEESCKDYEKDEYALGSNLDDFNEFANTARWDSRLLNYFIDTAMVTIMLMMGDLKNPLHVIMVSVFYYILLEGLAGWTIGKVITGTRVVNFAGQQPAMGQIIKRTLCRFIPFEALTFINSTGTGWHDIISRTRVIDAKDVNPTKRKHSSNPDVIDDVEDENIG